MPYQAGTSGVLLGPFTAQAFESGGSLRIQVAKVPKGETFEKVEIVGRRILSAPKGANERDILGSGKPQEVPGGVAWDFENVEIPGLYVFEFDLVITTVDEVTGLKVSHRSTVRLGFPIGMIGQKMVFEDLADRLYGRIRAAANKEPAGMKGGLRETMDLFEQQRDPNAPRFSFSEKETTKTGGASAGSADGSKIMITALGMAAPANVDPPRTDEEEMLHTMLHEIRHMAQARRLAMGMPNKDGDGVDDEWDLHPEEKAEDDDKQDSDAEQDAENFASEMLERI